MDETPSLCKTCIKVGRCMKLSVVTATFNCINAGNSDKLVRCLRSVATLAREHEHLIMDGASVDGTCGLINVVKSDLKRRHKRDDILLFRERDNGIYEALNKGFLRATGGWLYVLGSDDYIVDHSILEKSLEVGEAGDYDMIVCPVWNGESLKYVSHISRGYELVSLCYPHQGLIVKADFARKIGCFNVSYKVCADYDFIVNALLNGARVLICDMPFAMYNIDGFSSNNPLAHEENLKIRINRLGLTRKESVLASVCRVLPLRVILRFMFSAFPVVRYSARKQLLRNLAYHLGLIKRY